MAKKSFILFSLSIWAFFTFRANAQDRLLSDYLLNYYTNESGLPSNIITQIAQDKDGFIWLSSYNGLVRYDGMNFEIYAVNEEACGGKNNQIFTTLSLDHNQELLVHSQGVGLLKKTEKGDFVCLVPESEIGQIDLVFYDRDGVLWMASRKNKLCSFDTRKTLAITQYPEFKGTVNGFAQDPTGRIWIAASDGLYFSEDDRTGVFKSPLIDAVEVFDVDMLHAELVVSFNHALHVLRSGKFQVLISLPEGNVLDFKEDKNGDVWMGANVGMYKYTSKTGVLEYLSESNGFPHPYPIGKILLDREDNIWAVSYRGGMVQLRESSFFALTYKQGLPKVGVSSIGEYATNELYLGTDLGTVFRYKDKEIRKIALKSDFDRLFIRSITKDRSGKLWINSASKMLTYDPRTGIETPIKFESDIPSLMKSFHGSDGTVWISTRNLGVIRIGTDQKQQVIGKKDGLSSDFVMSISEDNLGQLWVATNNGGINVLSRDGKIVRRITQENGLVSNLIFSCQTDKNGVSWVATNGGINRIDGDRIFGYTTDHGLNAGAYFDVLEDDLGNFWMPTNSGLVHITKKDFEDVFLGKEKRLRIRIADKHDGLPNNEFIGSSLPIKGSDGVLWFPNSKGAVFVKPWLIQENKNEPMVYITSVYLDSTKLTGQENPSFKYGGKRIVIQYTGINFRSPEKTTFKYRLLGYQDDWVNVGHVRRQEWTNLDPGDYTFEVIAENNDGVPSKTAAFFTFTVTPVYWQTWWFYSICVSVLAMLIYSVYATRIRMAKAREKELAEKVERRTEEITEQKKKIELQNESILEKNNQLNSALNDLKSTQAQLIHSEKLTALGKLVASVAHEVNTPLGAIKASSSNIVNSIHDSGALLIKIFSEFRAAEAELFLHFIIYVEQQLAHSPLSGKEERRARLELAKLLGNEQVAHAEEIAELLVDMQVYSYDPRFLPFWKHELSIDIAKAAASYSSVLRSTSNIQLAVERASKVVFALKKYARQDHTHNKQVVDIKDNIETVLTIYWNLLKHGIEVVREYEDVPGIEGHPDELQQVWTNFIHNAIQAMKGKGKIIVRVKNAPGYVVVEIVDNGPGIPDDIKEKIFEPFFTTKAEGEGTGLGLSIVKQIIEKHQGILSVESEVGKGAKFIVSLPVHIK